MSEKLSEVLEQYDMVITGTRKGRGATILDTEEGTRILEPFRGNLLRLEQEYVLKQLLLQQGFSQMDSLIPNRDGMLFTCDRYRQPYVMKCHFDGNECDMHSCEDMVRSVRLLARFHTYGRKAAGAFDQAWRQCRQEKEQRRLWEIRQAVENGEELERIARIYDIRENVLREMLEREVAHVSMNDEASEREVAHVGMNDEAPEREVAHVGMNDKTLEREVSPSPASPQETVGSIFERHNRELKKIYKYISRVKRKNDFEKLFLQEFQGYYEQGQYCLDQHRHSLQEVSKKHYGICHGACNQHNIILGKVDALVHFERFTKGNQLNDLYQFTRKAMEKNHFELELLTRLLLAYDEVIPLSKEDYRYIYILFSYPEKFWKIANGYYNTNKAFLSPKYVEKLQNVIWQEEEKREMLKEYFAFHLQ
jgi:hypothetical protein